jgi:hypothetical protein
MSGFEAARFETHTRSGLVQRLFTKPMDVPVLTAAIVAEAHGARSER